MPTWLIVIIAIIIGGFLIYVGYYLFSILFSVCALTGLFIYNMFKIIFKFSKSIVNLIKYKRQEKTEFKALKISGN